MLIPLDSLGTNEWVVASPVQKGGTGQDVERSQHHPSQPAPGTRRPQVCMSTQEVPLGRPQAVGLWCGCPVSSQCRLAQETLELQSKQVRGWMAPGARAAKDLQSASKGGL